MVNKTEQVDRLKDAVREQLKEKARISGQEYRDLCERLGIPPRSVANIGKGLYALMNELGASPKVIENEGVVFVKRDGEIT